MEKLNEKINETIEKVVEEDNILGNIDLLYKLVDIHKDLANEKYWQNKEEIMRYRYGNYGENYGRRMRDSRGRYMEGNYGDDYGRRGVKGTGRGRYRGEEILDDMYQDYGNYSESREEYNESGSYGAKEDTKQSLKYMLKSVEEFMKMLEEEATSQEEVEMVKQTARKISQM